MVTIHYFIKKTQVFDKTKKNFTTPQSPKKYCYFGAFKIFFVKNNDQ